MSDVQDNLGRKVAKGAAWMVGMRMTIRGLGIISMLILARLLMPEDFGLVALASMVVGMVELLGQFGFDNAIIQNRKAGPAHYNSAWTLNLARGVLSALLLALVAVPVAGFFDEPRLTEIIYWLAIAAFVRGFENIGVVDFRRDLWFGKEYQFFVSAKLISFVVTLAAAIIWRSYWALVAGLIAHALASLVLSYALHPFRPRLSLEKAGELFAFSKWLLANEYLVFISVNIDRLLIGKFLNAATLGMFAIAKEISSLASQELILPITRAIYPGYAKIAHEPEQLRAMFLDTLGLVFLFAWPMAFGLAAIAEPLVIVVLGEKWLLVAELLPYLAVAGALSLAWANVSSLFMAIGQPKLATYTFAIGVVTRTVLLIGGFWWAGLTGLVQAMVLAPIILFPIAFYFVRSVIDLEITTYLATVWRAVLSSVLMYFCVIGMGGVLAEQLEIVRLLALLAAGALIFLAAQLSLWHLAGRPSGAEKTVLIFLGVRV